MPRGRERGGALGRADLTGVPPDEAGWEARVAAVVWSLVFVGVGYVGMVGLGTGILLGAEWLRPGLAGTFWAAAVAQTVAGIAIFGVLTWLIGIRALGLGPARLGWRSPREIVAGFGKGLGLGALIGAGAMTLGIAGGSGWSLDGGSPGAWLVRLVWLALILLPAAFMEELAFRGAAVAGLAKGMGRGPAIVATAVLFGIVHRGNPNVTGLGLGNIALAGLFLGLTFFARGGIGTATGAHLGWNWSLAGLGAPVSGLPFEVPWIDYQVGQPEWLTGGAFGPEGGLVATIALTVGALWVLRWRDFREAT